MMSAKAWYWLGLGILALSFMSSGSGRSAMDHAAAYVSCVRTRALPYLGAIEVAFGRSEAGIGHLQAGMAQTRARVEARRVQMEAAQARMEAAQERMVAARERLQDRRVQEQLRKAQEVMVNSDLMDRATFADEVIVPEVPMVPTVAVRNGAQQVVICPRSGLRVQVPAVHVNVASESDPI